MKKGQVLKATVERVDFPNKGIARAGEETIVVKNSLPGQKIKLSVKKVRNGKAEGRLLEVLEKSPSETESPCSLFGVCGGCTFLSLPYGEQLKVKEMQVKRLLDASLESQRYPWKWEGIKGSPAVYEYRNKMEFTFGDEVKDGPLTLGLHKRGSFYDVVSVGDCRIVDEDYRLILKAVQEYFEGGYRSYFAYNNGKAVDEIDGETCTGRFDGEIAEKHVDGEISGRIRYFHRLRHEGYLRHLVVRKAARTGDILAALVTTSQDPWGEPADTAGGAGGEAYGLPEGTMPKGKEGKAETENRELQLREVQLIVGFRDCLLKLEHSGMLKGHFAGILHMVNDSQADVVQSDRTDVLYGQDYFYEELLGLRFKISVFSFFQTNTFGAEVLYETARGYIRELENGEKINSESGSDGAACRVVFDLYSGTGTIAQLMASAAEKVIGVEIVEEAVRAARRNAEENGLDNCEFIAGDVLNVLDTLEEKPDLIILDPPRDGIHPKALPKIISYGVEHIVYISCKPTSLARDLESFLKYGYAVERAVAVDQFPWTANVETVCLLSNRKSDTKVRTDVDFGFQ